MTVPRSTCILFAVVVCLLVGAGVGLGVWFLRPSDKKDSSNCGNTTESATTVNPNNPVWPLDFDAGLIVRTFTDVQVYNTSWDQSWPLLQKSVSAIDFYKNKTLYYASSGGNDPVRSTWEEYPSLKYPGEMWDVTALAVDQVTGKVYVYDRQASKLDVFDLEGKYTNIVLSDLHMVKDIVLDLFKGYMFILQSSEILQVSMDGDGLRKIIENTDIIAFTLDRKNSYLYYCTSNVIIAYHYFYSHKTYKLKEISETASLTSLAIVESTLYYLSQDKNNNKMTLNSCDLDYPSGKCSNPRIRNSSAYSIQLKDFDLYNSVGMSNPCQYYDGGCQHLCILPARFETESSYSCRCHTGWQLNEDMKTCARITEYLMYVRGKYLRGRILNFEMHSFVDAIQPKRLTLNSIHPIQFDFNVHKNYFIYVDGYEMWRLNLLLHDGQQRLVLLEQTLQYEMLYPSVDYVANQLYYLRRHFNESNDSYLMVRHTDYSDGFDSQKIIYKFPKNERPRAMILFLNLGYIYFTVYDMTSKEAKIYRIAMDGSDLIAFKVKEEGFSVSDIALAFDYSTRSLYWFNEKKTEIQFATDTATKLRKFDISNVKNPTTINIHQDWLYIGNGSDVWCFHKETGKFAHSIFSQVGKVSNLEISAMKPFGENVQPINYNHPCSYNRGGCQKYCFGIPNEYGKLARVCGCNENEKLQDDGISCKYQIFSSNKNN